MAGTVVLGTTEGDIHEIGKILVGTLLSADGFRVHALGVDVAGEKFAAKTRELKAEIVGVSTLLATTMRNQRSVIEALVKAGLRSQVKVMVGGAPVTRKWAEEIGADGYAKDAMSAVTLARSLMERKQKQFRSRHMRPKFELLDKSLSVRILGEAFQLIEEPGVRVAPYVVELLRRGGCSSDRRSGSYSGGTGSAIAGNRPAQFLPLRPARTACDASRRRSRSFRSRLVVP